MWAVCRGAGAGAGRHRRQLLRARRAFAAGDPADQPDPGEPGCRDCIRSLFEAPSVEALAKRLVRGRPALSDFEVLLPIRPTGSKLPLFCIHDAGGFSWPYSKLIRHIPSEHPIYGLQARNLTQRASAPDQSMRWRKTIVGLIRKIQPSGSLQSARLVVRRSGCACHRHAAAKPGEQVAMLALLDSYPMHQEGAFAAFDDDTENLRH